MDGLSHVPTMLKPAPDTSASCSHCGRTLDCYRIPGGAVINQACSCEGYKAAVRARFEKDEADYAERMAKDRIERKLSACGVGKRYLDAETYDIFDQYAASFRDHLASGSGLVITGRYGSGKTHAASAIVLRLIRDGYTAGIVSAVDLLAAIKQSFGNKEAEAVVISKYTGIDLLVIDDLGKEQVTPWSLQQLYSLIDQRYRELKPMIVTTQYTGAELANHWSDDDAYTGEAIISRLRDACIQVSMGKVDRRAT